MHDREVLKWLLNQYIRATRRKRHLMDLLETLNAEINMPIRAQQLTGMPHGGGISGGAADIVERKCEYQERIEAQQATEAKAIVRVLQIIEFLPGDSEEREILESRYLKGEQWAEIAQYFLMSVRSATRIHGRALDMLLEAPDIQRMVEDNRLAYAHAMYGRADEHTEESPQRFVDKMCITCKN